jgi:Winged helix DNA-binding domain
MPRSRADTVLSSRALNRALLERQMLLRRRRMPVLEAVERLVALQAQVPRDPYVALWSRLDRFRPEALSEALADRRAVRLTLLRGTLHLATAGDALALRPVFQPIIERVLFGSSPLRRAVESVDLDELLAFFRDLLETEPRTRAELVRAAADRWPGVDADSLGYAMYLLPTVQVTPRGLWGRSGRSAFTTLERWLGRPGGPASDPGEVIFRYLAVFGPATAADVRAWSGLAGIPEVLEGLAPRLRTFRDEPGRELFDVPDGPLPDPDRPAPVRFLPEYDNILLGHDDRSRIVPEGVPRWTDVGWGGVLVDGLGAARWQAEATKTRAILRVEPFVRLRRADREAVSAEGARLLELVAPEAEKREVTLAGP